MKLAAVRSGRMLIILGTVSGKGYNREGPAIRESCCLNQESSGILLPDSERGLVQIPHRRDGEVCWGFVSGSWTKKTMIEIAGRRFLS